MLETQGGFCVQKEHAETLFFSGPFVNNKIMFGLKLMSTENKNLKMPSSPQSCGGVFFFSHIALFYIIVGSTQLHFFSLFVFFFAVSVCLFSLEFGSHSCCLAVCVCS